jgi:hypothetical protein
MFQGMSSFRSYYQNQLRSYAELLLVPGHGLTADEVRGIKNPDLRKSNPKFQELLGLDPSASEDSIKRYSITPLLLTEPNFAANDALEGLFQSSIIKRACILSNILSY